jgi:hypothetical protein
MWMIDAMALGIKTAVGIERKKGARVAVMGSRDVELAHHSKATVGLVLDTSLARRVIRLSLSTTI